MKKSVYIISSIEITVGAFILAICSTIKDIFSHLELGKRIIQAGSDAVVVDKLSLPAATAIAVLLIVAGLGQMALSVIKNNKEKS